MTSRVPLPSAVTRFSSDPDLTTSQENLDNNNCPIPHGERQEPQGEETLIADELNSTLVIRNNASIDGYSSPFYGKHAPPYPGNPHIVNQKAQGTQGVQEITEIPKHYLDQSTVLKHLAKEIQIQPPTTSSSTTSPNNSTLTMAPMHPPNQQLASLQMAVGLGSNATTQEDNGNTIISMLILENQNLRGEVELCQTKISRLEQLEDEAQKLQEAHQEIILANERRERIESVLRTKLEQEIQRLKSGRQQHPDLGDLQQELSRRDLLIAQLLGQNKELLCEKERKDVEIQAQNATLAEQRKHIDILDHALTNAQANIVRYEEEVRKKEFYVERVHELQKALQQMQAASERRLEMEKKMRSELEKDVQSLGRKGGDGEELRRTIRDYEEKVVALEGEVARWEQKYLEESALRQMAVDAASVPKDARIAALERTSLETERLISQARSEKLRQMDELHATQRKCAELESRLKDMESKLAERDAMIRVLQQRSSIHARAASSVALTHHRRTGSKDESITDRAAIDESLKEFGSRLANKTSLLGPSQGTVLPLSSSVSKSTSNLSSTPEGKLSIPLATLDGGEETEEDRIKEWRV